MSKQLHVKDERKYGQGKQDLIEETREMKEKEYTKRV
jgi:hypothetical protein